MDGRLLVLAAEAAKPMSSSRKNRLVFLQSKSEAFEGIGRARDSGSDESKGVP